MKNKIKKDLVDDFIYEIQNIPVYLDGKKFVTQYFSNNELGDIIEKNYLKMNALKKKHINSNLSYFVKLSSAIDCFKILVKDCKNKYKNRKITVNGTDLDLKKHLWGKNAVRNFNALINDYTKLLNEKIGQNYIMKKSIPLTSLPNIKGKNKRLGIKMKYKEK